MEYHTALDNIIREARANPKNTSLQYGASYAKAGYGMVGEERRVQILYICNNLSTWRGPLAKLMKQALKGMK